ncbi:MAG: polymerase subunit delta [Actinomycetota bacterium]|nr:polymerase subunit delta [Actinomycetota bacterium]
MTSTDAPVLPVYLVKGDDPTLIADAVHALVAELVGTDDAALVVEDVGGDYELRAVIDAAQTPPFFGDRRVVIARDVGRFLTADVAPLVAYLADPLDTTRLVLVAGGGQMSRSITDAVRKVGHVVDAGVPTGRNRSTWVAARIKEGPVRLDGAAVDLAGRHLGEDLGRLTSLLETLAVAYGAAARVGVDELAPFLGEAGGVAPWELTDAIDRGDSSAALVTLHRLLNAGARHPLVVLATLHSHFARMLRLDGADAPDESAAAQILGLTGSTYPAKKALLQARRLGSAPIGRAITLLADADLALKGAVEWPAELVMEVLVARLSRLAPAPASRSRR